MSEKIAKPDAPGAGVGPGRDHEGVHPLTGHRRLRGDLPDAAWKGPTGHDRHARPCPAATPEDGEETPSDAASAMLPGTYPWARGGTTRRPAPADNSALFQLR